MLAGAAAVPGRRARCVEIGDRAAAIAPAVGAARPGDAVVVAGKGHEPGRRSPAWCTLSTTAAELLRRAITGALGAAA